MKNKEAYLHELHQRLHSYFTAIKHQHPNTQTAKHRLEGFMQAGVSMEIASKNELNQLMEEVHYQVFNLTLEERAKQKSTNWQAEKLDYSQFEEPAYRRRN